MELTGERFPNLRRTQMKKTMLAIVFAAASLPLTFAQSTPAPNQSTDQTSTAPAKKAKKHSTKKTSSKKTTTSAAQK